jgi:hypothetical protein
MLWSDRLVMVIGNNSNNDRSNSADKEEDTLWKSGRNDGLKGKSEKRCQHQFRNFTRDIPCEAFRHSMMWSRP